MLAAEHQTQLDIIKKNYPGDVRRCCTEMFLVWLRLDTEASWSALIKALEKNNMNNQAENIRKNILQGNLSYDMYV